ncbi:MAG TPA: orotidine-5'-phosphate decarboxylase [Fimbriimonadaceae bacterium]|jgi:orotidine-5'-phosphate decarboxylase
MIRKVICALDTGNLEEALTITGRLKDCVGAFKIGHALTLQYGLDVIPRLQDAGATRVFLDLKFHDIPNSVALAVREAAKRDVWMMTLHISGGPAMMEAAVYEARAHSDAAPNLVGVSVLTSLDEHTLTDVIGVKRNIHDQMVSLSQLAMDCGLDGIVCSPQEIKAIRQVIGHQGCIVTPGIRHSTGEKHDQSRVGTAEQALADGADYLVVGRALTHCEDIEAALAGLGFETTTNSH